MNQVLSILTWLFYYFGFFSTASLATQFAEDLTSISI